MDSWILEKFYYLYYKGIFLSIDFWYCYHLLNGLCHNGILKGVQASKGITPRHLGIRSSFNLLLSIIDMYPICWPGNIYEK